MILYTDNTDWSRYTTKKQLVDDNAASHFVHGIKRDLHVHDIESFIPAARTCHVHGKLRDDYRSHDNFIRADHLFVDIDSIDILPIDLCDHIKGKIGAIEFYAAPSISCTDKKTKYHIYFPSAEYTEPVLYKRDLRRIAYSIGGDMAAAEPLRLFFPSRPGEAGYYHCKGESISVRIGTLLDPPKEKKSKQKDIQWDSTDRDESLKYHIREFLEKHGHNPDAMLCPKHNDTNTGNFSLEPHGTNYYCFACKQAVDIYDFAAKEYQLDIKNDFRKIKFRLERELGVKGRSTNRILDRENQQPDTEEDIQNKPILDLDDEIEFHNKVREVTRAIKNWPDYKDKIFTKKDLIVEVKEKRLKLISESRMRDYASKACFFVKESRTADPPKDIIQGIFGKPERFDSIKSIKTYPELATQGIVQYSGYDSRTQCYYDIPALPKIDTIAEAIANLDDVFVDFPLASPSDRANLYALLLTFIMRERISSIVPGFITIAPVQGSGKTLLNKAVLVLLLGENPIITSMPKNEEEFQKRIGSEILSGKPYIFIDNLKNKIDSESLAVAITSERIGFRILGSNNMDSGENEFVFLFTANNPTIDKDLIRRFVPIKLDANRENPENINPAENRHPDILKYIKENRPRMLASLLYLASQEAWGEYKGPFMGSFERWSMCIGEVLLTAGVPGFLGNLKVIREGADTGEESLAAFVDAWAEKYGGSAVITADLVQIARDTDLIPEYAKDEKQYIAKLLNKNKDRIIHGWKIIKGSKAQNKVHFLLTNAKP
jgi:hypothetical protein